MVPAPSPLRRRRLALVAAAAAWSLCAATGASAAAGVEVQLGDRSTTLDPGQIAAEADVASANWRGEGQDEGPDGLSLRKLVAVVGGDPDGVRSITISGDGGSSARFGARMLAEGPPFGEGPAVPPLVWVDDAGVHAARPTAPGQLADQVDATGAEPLRLEVVGGVTLDVTATASRRRVERGHAIRLAAEVDGELPADARFVWRLGDGASDEGRVVRHAYRKDGTFRPRVTVTTAEATGTSPALTVRVGRERDDDPTPDDDGDGAGAGTGSGSGTGAGADDHSAPATSTPTATRRPAKRSRRRTVRRSRPTERERDPLVRGSLLGAPAATAAQAAAPRRAGGDSGQRPSATAQGDGLSISPAGWSGIAAAALVVTGALAEGVLLRRRRIA